MCVLKVVMVPPPNAKTLNQLSKSVGRSLK